MSQLAPYLMVDDVDVELGKPCRIRGNVVVFEKVGQRMTIDEDHPSIYGAHLLGYEGDVGRVYYFRTATDKEKATFRDEVQAEAFKRQRRRDAQDRLLLLKKQFCEEGTYPRNVRVTLEGDVLLDTQDIRGGGDWFVLAENKIWYVRNNGRDNDDWSQNNVNTGGAGAIGVYLPRSAGVEGILREIAEAYEETE